MTDLSIPNSLICGVQALGDAGGNHDCSSPLVSDGCFWSCPYGHVQGFDGAGKPVRKIADRRTSVHHRRSTKG